ncbi:MAG: hypothetical protein KKH70_20300, partial [Gammaproteobacteria bacterium]|nr:hypothetical protein [Gammaproteobacteria bacterium]
MPNVTTTQTETVKLTASLKRKLLLKLRTFEELHTQIAAAKAAQAGLKTDIEKLFVDVGEFEALQAGVKIDGFAVNHISGTSTKLDKEFILAQGWMTA